MIGYIEDLLYDEELNFINEILPGVRPQFRSSTIIGQMNSILADNGIGLIPYFMAHSEGTLVSVLPELSIDRTFWIQFNPDSRRIARVRATIDFIVEEMESSKLILSRLPRVRPEQRSLKPRNGSSGISVMKVTLPKIAPFLRQTPPPEYRCFIVILTRRSRYFN